MPPKLRVIEGGQKAVAVDTDCLIDEIAYVLGHSWFFDAETIQVETEGGRVRLSGAVHTVRERKLAAATAWRFANVTDVKNDIVVAPALVSEAGGSGSIRRALRVLRLV